MCPLRHTFRVSEPVLPYLQHASCFQPRAAPRPHLARAIKNPTARLAVGDKVKDSAVPPRLTRHRCRTLSSLIDCQHSQASYASFTSSATRHLSPRPSGAHIIGFGPCRHHTIADSLSVRLPFSSRQRFVKLFLCYHRIFPLSTDFDPLFQIFRPIKPQRAPSAHPCAHRIIVVPHRPTNFPPRVSRTVAACSRARIRSSLARHEFDKNKKQPAPKTHAQNHRRISMILCARPRVVRPHTACFASIDYS